jgi:hypothetical protein
MGDPVAAFLAAASEPSDEQLAVLEPFLAAGVAYAGPRGRGSGAEVLREALRSPFLGALRNAEWSEPERHGDVVELTATFPPAAPAGGAVFALALADCKIARIDHRALPPAPLVPVAVDLTGEIEGRIAGALDNDTPMLIAYVDANGWSKLSYRGSVVVLEGRRLGLWARDPEGGLPTAIAERPRVTLFYSDPQARTRYQFYGIARIADDTGTTRQVYESMHPVERDADLEARGVAVLVDVERIEGLAGGLRVLMSRDAP